MRTYETHAGENIAHAADEMVKLANFSNEQMAATFSDIPSYFTEGDTHMKMPDELYVQIEGKGEDEFLNAQPALASFAIAGDTVTVTLYRKVGVVRISAPIKVIKP